VICGYGPG